MITVEEATSYFTNERLFSEKWLESTDQQKSQSLKMAENQINRLQLNSNEDEFREIRFKKAVCEQALFLVQTLNSKRSILAEQGVSSFSVEGLSESYDLSKAKNKICLESMEYLKPYIVGAVAIC